MKADLAKKAEKRTCVPNWKGLIYPFKAHRHVSSELINDDEATRLLEQGALRAKDFKVLPKGYIKPNHNPTTIKDLTADLQNMEDISEIKALLIGEKRVGAIKAIEERLEQFN